jgi:upstream activation factor subunit UAF30
MSRPQVVKKLWEHIKANGLQDPSNRKEILCDEMMKSIFNVEKIDMFQMNKALGT